MCTRVSSRVRLRRWLCLRDGAGMGGEFMMLGSGSQLFRERAMSRCRRLSVRRRPSINAVLIVATCAALGFPKAGLAEDADPKTQARQHYERGTREYNLGRFQSSI